MRNLSILIPSYNDICLPLVEKLKALADCIDGLKYEILVGDDGSTAKEVITQNRKIAKIANCRFIEREKNSGRAAIRNFLANEAKHEWLVFLDCEVEPAESLIADYAESTSLADVICGGVKIAGNSDELKHNLRYLYEKSMEPSYTAIERNKRGYYSFRTTNFMIRKSAMNAVPFNEDIKTYGYEDVVFGKCLKTNNFTIEHIDNAVSMYRYETNKRFVEKTEEALRTLNTFAEEIGGYSPILNIRTSLKKCHLLGLARFCFSRINTKLRINLCGANPKLLCYKLYKLGYFINI